MIGDNVVFPRQMEKRKIERLEEELPSLKTSFGNFAGRVLKDLQGRVVAVDEEMSKTEVFFEMADGFDESETFKF